MSYTWICAVKKRGGVWGTAERKSKWLLSCDQRQLVKDSLTNTALWCFPTCQKQTLSRMIIFFIRCLWPHYWHTALGQHWGIRGERKRGRQEIESKNENILIYNLSPKHCFTQLLKCLQNKSWLIIIFLASLFFSHEIVVTALHVNISVARGHLLLMLIVFGSHYYYCTITHTDG